MATNSLTRSQKSLSARMDSNLWRLLLITVAVFLIMGLLRPHTFLTLRNFRSMSYQFPELGVLSIAMMLTMLTGGIDLSVVGTANLAGILAAKFMISMVPAGGEGPVGIAILGAILIALGIGVLCGLFNGFLVSKVGIPPILATLGTMQLYMGIAIVITKGYAVLGYPEQFLFIGNGVLWIFPIPLILFVIVAAIFTVILNKTAFGLHVFMLGTNATAARFSGINNTLVLMRTYLISGFLAGLAGIIVIARTNSAKADYGTSYVLQAVLVSILGGVNPSGGFGTVSGLILAILSLQFLSSGFNMLRFSNFFKEFIWGFLLILVMVINYLSTSYQYRHRLGRQKKMAKA